MMTMMTTMTMMMMMQKEMRNKSGPWLLSLSRQPSEHLFCRHFASQRVSKLRNFIEAFLDATFRLGLASAFPPSRFACVPCRSLF